MRGAALRVERVQRCVELLATEELRLRGLLLWKFRNSELYLQSSQPTMAPKADGRRWPAVCLARHYAACFLFVLEELDCFLDACSLSG